jgi:hypothetical protein
VHPGGACARLASFNAIIRRTTGIGIGSPTPAECDNTIFALQSRKIRSVNPDVLQIAEPGVDAVDGFGPGPADQSAGPAAARKDQLPDSERPGSARGERFMPWAFEVGPP